MAVRGSYAKDVVAYKLSKMFGEDYIGKVGDKYYLWVSDGSSEKIQIAIAMTCPKNYVNSAEAIKNDEDNDTGSSMKLVATPSVNFTEDEINILSGLMEKFNL